ncbi:hypothetical protein NRP93_003027 [Clostridium botulinum]|nr:hypothetical protein [Clostridium botulinum]
MKKMSKLKIGCLIIITCLIVILAHNLVFNNFDSDTYLTSSKSSVDVEYLGHEKNISDGTSFDFSGFNGIWSLITFDSTKDNKIAIDNNSKINKGKFYVILLDSDHNPIIIDKSNKKKLEFTTPKKGKYTIRVAGKNASGTFQMKINSSSKIAISHYDIYSAE